MLSERQLNANRRNAQLSTGPRTPEGRAAVSLNALRHGLTAQTAVLPGENTDEFQELLDSFLAEYQPTGPTEILLVEQMAMAAWRLRRLRALETGLFQYRISQLRDDIEGLDPRARAFANDATGSRSIETLSRYETRIERSFYRALHELDRLRAAPPLPEPAPVHQDPAPPENNSENQTHSQNRTPAGPEPAAFSVTEAGSLLPCSPKHRRTALSGNGLSRPSDFESRRHQFPQLVHPRALNNLAALRSVEHYRHAAVRVAG